MRDEEMWMRRCGRDVDEMWNSERGCCIWTWRSHAAAAHLLRSDESLRCDSLSVGYCAKGRGELFLQPATLVGKARDLCLDRTSQAGKEV